MYWLISKYNFQLTENISVFVCPYRNAIGEFTAVSVINFWRTECVMREKFYFVSLLKFYRSEVQLMSILKFDWISNVCCFVSSQSNESYEVEKHLKLELLLIVRLYRTFTLYYLWGPIVSEITIWYSVIWYFDILPNILV